MLGEQEPWAEELPAFSEFIVDLSGRLWVRGAHWQDAIGAGSLSCRAQPVVGVRCARTLDRRVGMPTGFQPLEIGTDYATGIRRTDGVNQVVIYELSVRGR